MNTRTPPMLPDEVRKAVERLDQTGYGMNRAWQTIKAHMLAREAEVERLQNIAYGNAELYQHELLRTERADALLREALPNLYDNARNDISNRITAHLSENNRGDI